VLALALLAVDARAYELTDSRWLDTGKPIPFWVAEDMGQGGVDDKKALATILRAFETWQAVECAPIDFVFSGRVEGAAFGDPPDGRNTVFLVAADWPRDPKVASARDVTVDGEYIVEGDIGLNATTRHYAIDGDGKEALDLEAATAYEIGHVLGLADSLVEGATMSAGMLGNPDARSLEQDDIDGLCALYAEGETEPPQGAACANTGDCREGYLCVVDNGEQYCAARCVDDDTCDDGTSCVDPGSGSPVCIADRPRVCATSSGQVSLALALAGILLAGARRIR
jgi:hypothetical protein